MTARALMLQGTGSDVGKSLLTAALVRVARRRGMAVAPFKPQNMSNNAAACADGGEIGRAQALQAQAAGLAPRVDFNPVLLKPQTDRTSQVVVHGKAVSARNAKDYMRERQALMVPVLESFQRLIREFDLVIVEGAGSPAEINLRRGDIANMGFARRADVPVCLVADIDRGGVIASVVGTQAVLDAEDAAMIVGYMVNKFRGDPSLFDTGIEAIAKRTGWRSFGVIPWLPDAARLPAEDAVSLSTENRGRDDTLRIVAPMLSRMANFDDADPLRQQPGVSFEWIPPGHPIPRDSDVVLLFGTKSTLGELEFLRAQGWDHDVLAHARCGGHVLGVCGGYQMLGRQIHDPEGADGPPGSAEGLGLLDVDTTMHGEKTVRPVNGECMSSGLPVSGYEIHAGTTLGPDCARPLFRVDGREDGAVSKNGRIAGTYLHGMFANDAFRTRWLQGMQSRHFETYDYAASVDAALDALADHVEDAADVDALLATARRPVAS
ncbi:MAG: cobyric acid synthase [Pseudomonadota bacterium]